VLETELTEGGTVLGRFGVPGLTLAVVGIYGVMTYSVSLREREIGIRLALGVDRRAVQRLVLGEGLLIAVTDTVIGMAAERLNERRGWVGDATQPPFGSDCGSKLNQSCVMLRPLECFANHSRRKSWVRRKFDGVLDVPCHSLLKRTIAVSTPMTLSAAKYSSV